MTARAKSHTKIKQRPFARVSVCYASSLTRSKTGDDLQPNFVLALDRMIQAHPDPDLVVYISSEYYKTIPDQADQDVVSVDVMAPDDLTLNALLVACSATEAEIKTAWPAFHIVARGRVKIGLSIDDRRRSTMIAPW